jgi:pyrroloquinoline-quinone synthase
MTRSGAPTLTHRLEPMATTESMKAIDASIAKHHLLKHPFYEAWTAGTLPREALLDYARQYYAFESNLPRYLTALHARSESATVRAALLANAWDEEHGDNNHPELWLRFAEALGLERSNVIGAPLHEATRKLVDTYREAAQEAPVEAGVAALYAYESQLPAVAEAKIAGLRKHYGIETRDGLAFFEVHRAIDVHHAAQERRILQAADGSDDGESAVAWADRALKAWWDFLTGVLQEHSVAA